MDGVYFHLYTEKARRAHFVAFQSAIDFGREEIKATDLLVGLLRAGRALFTKRKLSKKKLQDMEEACHTSGPRRTYVSGTFMPYDGELKSILFRAAREMLNRRHEELDLEHLLLALLYVSSPAKVILNDHGLTYEKESARMPFHAPTEPRRGSGLDYT
jgi:ATP-dependent Clp protease ATP-binding subunit ClpA